VHAEVIANRIQRLYRRTARTIAITGSSSSEAGAGIVTALENDLLTLIIDDLKIDRVTAFELIIRGIHKYLQFRNVKYF